jgi:hypothetical protein
MITIVSSVFINIHDFVVINHFNQNPLNVGQDNQVSNLASGSRVENT